MNHRRPFPFFGSFIISGTCNCCICKSALLAGFISFHHINHITSSENQFDEKTQMPITRKHRIYERVIMGEKMHESSITVLAE
jgi:hypothetical protein